MKHLTILVCCLFGMLTQTQAQVSFGKAEKLNDGWRFLRVDSLLNIRERTEMREPGYDDSRWRRITLPHDWGVELPMSPEKGSCQGYLPGGIAWYRKDLHITPKPQEKYYIYFEGVYNYSEVYLNGQLLGYRPSGFASFLYDLTPYLNADGENVLAVHVNHKHEADSRWYTGSGIYRMCGWLLPLKYIWHNGERLIGLRTSARRKQNWKSTLRPPTIAKTNVLRR